MQAALAIQPTTGSSMNSASPPNALAESAAEPSAPSQPQASGLGVPAQAVIVVPVYKPALDELEHFSIEYSLARLAGHPVVFIHPEGLDTGYYAERFGGQYLPLPREFFASHRNYNQLCYETGFYAQFAQFSHMLLLQPDALVVSTGLASWLEAPYDYLGGPEATEYQYDLRTIAPFNRLGFMEPVRLYGCNGGLSLRRPAAIIDALNEYPELTQVFRSHGVGIGEDIFFSLLGRVSRAFRVPNEVAASRFAITDNFAQWQAFNDGKLPFGFHAWYRREEDKQLVLRWVYEQSGAGVSE